MGGGNGKSGVSWQARGPLDDVGRIGLSTSGPSLGHWGPDSSVSWLRGLCKEERPWAGPECQAGASPFTEGHPGGRGWLWGACGALHATQPRYLTGTGSWSSLSESGHFLLELGRQAGPQGWAPACSPVPHLLLGPGQVKPLSVHSIYTLNPQQWEGGAQWQESCWLRAAGLVWVWWKSGFPLVLASLWCHSISD